MTCPLKIEQYKELKTSFQLDYYEMSFKIEQYKELKIGYRITRLKISNRIFKPSPHLDYYDMSTKDQGFINVLPTGLI